MAVGRLKCPEWLRSCKNIMCKKLTKKPKISIVIASVLCFAIVVGSLGVSYSKCFLPSKLKIPADADLNQKTELIDEWLWELHNEDKFNGAVLVAKEGEILFDKTYGYTDVERKTRLTNQSSFNLASVSKQFTAMTIMILAEQGKLNYDDPVNKYLPELNYPDITIRHLLHHTSGLEDFEYLADEYYNENKIFTNEDFCSLMGISKRTCQHWRDQKWIEFSQVSNKIFYTWDQIEAFLEKHKVEVP